MPYLSSVLESVAGSYGQGCESAWPGLATRVHFRKAGNGFPKRRTSKQRFGCSSDSTKFENTPSDKRRRRTALPARCLNRTRLERIRTLREVTKSAFAILDMFLAAMRSSCLYCRERFSLQQNVLHRRILQIGRIAVFTQ